MWTAVAERSGDTALEYASVGKGRCACNNQKDVTSKTHGWIGECELTTECRGFFESAVATAFCRRTPKRFYPLSVAKNHPAIFRINMAWQRRMWTAVAERSGDTAL